MVNENNIFMENLIYISMYIDGEMVKLFIGLFLFKLIKK